MKAKNTRQKASAVSQIRAVSTPNPQAMKFFLPHMLTEEGLYYDFFRARATEAPPLPKALFLRFKALNQVFVMQNFLTINKTPEAHWQDLVPQIQDFLLQYIEKGKSLEIVAVPTERRASAKEEAPTMAQRIEKILEEYVKPAVARDGGAIAFDSYEAGWVRVRLKGACSGCPSATLTLKAGIERLLKSMLPEIEAVEAIEE